MAIQTGDKLLTTQDAATELGISRRQVQTLIEKGKLPAERIGRDFLIRASDLRLVRVRPKGRPFGAKDSRPRKSSRWTSKSRRERNRK